MSIMPVWDNDQQTVMRYVFYGSWKWEDMDVAINKARAMNDKPVHVIVDLRESCAIPSLPATRRSLVLTSDHAQMLVLVGEAYLTQPFFDVANRVYRLGHDRDDVVYVDNMEDARHKIERTVQPDYI